MPWSVNLDDIRDIDKKKLLIDFIYKTTISQTTRDVWGDFKVQRFCSSKRHIEEQEKPVLFYYNILYCQFFNFIVIL